MSRYQISAAAIRPHLIAASPAQFGTWIGYSGHAKITLAIVLLAAAAAVAYAGTRLRQPIRTARRGRAFVAVLLMTLLLAIAALGICISIYVQQLVKDHLVTAPPNDPITPVTVIGVMAVFFIVFITSSHEWRIRLAGATIAAMAAPMIFELPFDLIVMARTYPPVAPDPALYRVLFFAPLFTIEATTLALLTCSPMVRLSRASFLSFASMLAVFAIWALAGFSYPSAPVPVALNVLSKILALVTTVGLFLPQRRESAALVAKSDAPLAEAGQRA